MGDPADPTVIFLHLPKTGGTTLSHILVRHYLPDEIFHVRNPDHAQAPRYSRWSGTLAELIGLSEERRARFRCVLGHVPFGIHEHLPGASRYLTVLREPVARVLSKHRQKVHHDFESYANGSPTTPAEYVNAHPGVLHEQTQMLAGPAAARPTEDSVQVALRNMRAHPMLAGTTERFDELLLVLARELGWRFIHYQRLNVTHRYRFDCPADLEEALRRRSEGDRAVYEQADRMLDETIARYGPGFATDLAAFRRANGNRWVRRRSLRKAVAVQRAAISAGRGVGATPRVLVEACKLADPAMDGIKRYVVELLRAFRSSATSRRFDVDVLIGGHVVPLEVLPESYLLGADRQAEPAAAATPARSGRDRVLHGIGVLVPPVLLPVLKRVIPDGLSRWLLGKPKAELRAPSFDESGGEIAMLFLPGLLRSLRSRRVVYSLLVRGLFQTRAAVDLRGYDLIHLTLPNNHHRLGRSRAPLLVTIHDLSHLRVAEHQTRANRATLAVGLRAAVRREARFLSVSESTKRQLVASYGVDPARIETTHLGCNPAAFGRIGDPAALRAVRERYRIPDGRFLLTLGTIEPRKNLARTIQAFERLAGEPGGTDATLVIAGAIGWKANATLRAANRNAMHVHLAGYVSEADLAALYSAATGFVYASEYEGFGLPLLEAMCSGCPVVYGNTSSMPEIVGNAGFPADPYDVADIARQMRRLLADEMLAGDLARRGIERAREFSWARTASQTVHAWERALSRRPR